MDQINAAIATLTRHQEGMLELTAERRSAWVEAVASGSADERDLYMALQFSSGRTAGLEYALGELRAIAEGHALEVAAV